MAKELDPAQIANLLKADEKKEQAKRASQIRRKIYPTEPRNYDNWWKQPTHFGKCSNEHCVDPRELNSTMVAEINGSEICRYCFLAGVNKAVA